MNAGNGAGPRDVVIHDYDMFTPDGGTQLLTGATLRSSPVAILIPHAESEHD